MRSEIAALIQKVTFTIILVVAALTPILFTSFTTEYYETPKLILLAVGVMVLMVLWSLAWILEGKVIITRTPLDLPLILLLVVVLLSTFFSESRYVAIFGNYPKFHGSAISWIAYILFYFVVASNIKNAQQIKSVVYTMLASATLVAVVSLLSYFSFFLPMAFAKSVNFTPTGSSFSTTALLVLLLPMLVASIVNPSKFIPLPFALLLSSLFASVIVLIGTPATEISAVVASVLGVMMAKQADFKKSLPFLAIPVGIALVLVVLGFVPSANNPLSSKKANFPVEIQLPFVTSWKVSASAFRDSPFLGTGPSTYLFNFTYYKPTDYNSTNIWNLRFDTAYNEFLYALGTIGGLGFVALLFFCVVILNFGLRGMRYSDNNLASGLAIGAIAGVCMLILHPTTVVMFVAFLSILAMLMALHKSTSNVEELTIGIKASKLKNTPFGDSETISNMVAGDILPMILFIPIFIMVLIGLYNTYQVVSSDYYHRLALNAASSQSVNYDCPIPGSKPQDKPTAAIVTYNCLVKAETLNPRIDLVRTDLAQTNFALANAIASAKGPTETSPSGSLTDQDKQTIQQLLSQSIAEAKNSIVLSQKNPQNYEVLASIYRQVAGVAENALSFSLDAYGRAIERDPLNPLLRLNVGGIYYSIKNYDLAIRFFSDAVNLKQDYANAYYNLSVALRDKGDLKSAETVAEQVVSILQKDTKNPDYKTASEYLADLKARIATGSAQQSQITPPAAVQNGALQNKNIPGVSLDELRDKPENISTPAAVKK